MKKPIWRSIGSILRGSTNEITEDPKVAKALREPTAPEEVVDDDLSAPVVAGVQRIAGDEVIGVGARVGGRLRIPNTSVLIVDEKNQHHLMEQDHHLDDEAYGHTSPFASENTEKDS